MPNSEIVELTNGLDAPWPAAPSNVAVAWGDLRTGLLKAWFWTALAYQDIKLRYRGSMIGPFWLTLSTVIMVAAMGLIYAHLFRQRTSSYLPYLTVGIILWNFISMQINEGCQTFVGAQGVIQQVPLPFSVHAYRTVYRNLIVMAHSLIILPPVAFFFHVPVGWITLSAIPGLLVLCINGIWFSLLFGMASARYRDIPPIVQNFVTVLFFVTPIFWLPSALGKWQTLFELNPLFAAIDVVRSPLLGQSPAPYSWAVMLLMTAIGSGVTFLLFARFHSRIAYWI